MDQNYITFRTFNDEALAQQTAAVLEEKGIECTVVNTTGFDPSFSNNPLTEEYSVKLRKDDLIKAREAMMEATSDDLAKVDDDHYLYDFSNEELVELIKNKDEWNDLDVLLAQKLLRERGAALSKTEIKELEDERNEELARPESIKTYWIIIAYIFTLMGGILGVVIGIFVYTLKKKDAKGNTMFVYRKQDRTHALVILIIGAIWFCYLIYPLIHYYFLDGLYF